jgi:hypothetical protein
MRAALPPAQEKSDFNIAKEVSTIKSLPISILLASLSWGIVVSWTLGVFPGNTRQAAGQDDGSDHRSVFYPWH